jgi:hypothetical protein
VDPVVCFRLGDVGMEGRDIWDIKLYIYLYLITNWFSNLIYNSAIDREGQFCGTERQLSKMRYENKVQSARGRKHSELEAGTED